MKTKTPSPPQPTKLVYTMREVADLLGLSYNSIFRLNQRGLLRSTGGLRTKMFTHEEVMRYLRDNLEEARA